VAAPSAAAGTDRDAYAEVAGKPNGKKGPRDTGEAPEIPPSAEPLPEDGPAFVEALHERLDLLEVGKSLLESADEKIKQRAWERMLEMRYGKGAPAVEEAQHIVIDLPRPVRD
jgi:hypothetical protein